MRDMLLYNYSELIHFKRRNMVYNMKSFTYKFSILIEIWKMKIVY